MYWQHVKHQSFLNWSKAAFFFLFLSIRTRLRSVFWVAAILEQIRKTIYLIFCSIHFNFLFTGELISKIYADHMRICNNDDQQPKWNYLHLTYQFKGSTKLKGIFILIHSNEIQINAHQEIKKT